MHLKDVLEQIGYRFVSVDKYLWKCFGENAYYLDFKSVDGTPIGSVIYDAETAEVYEISVEVPGMDLVYRWIDIDARASHLAESMSRDIDPDLAWDDVKFTNVEIEEDFLEKLRAIVNGEDFDTRISVPLNLSEAEELALYRLAHESDMTVNDYVAQLLQNEIDAAKSGKYMHRYGW